ncbi:putative proline--tRNA ligase, mitochondrial [Microcaecilia unicolor]|uniref:Probable proline--tRNA ligase, mitochondrial n=1 Tax=Microcaecilia unicolor TaxID=1415580 RepID=A0A6P7Y3X3_9AMPH|nr:probable proline--tRNA ligase, mitochondrial [Microcaecilia unicolor]XP_030062221.1 probable proline--tRNA ligase, mitochondrial [Microcaecilia unicolor]XP_030062222.1 probable proline--tRNA ligase, mitochondrial [Microcaecilia unicolor]XP_030062224.1 probable proline--tRNA ligase, mitochondrial [Microcaecilia unicolor]XP_030062225.1 probable proline--tRNA ligase, mitochondrial [Microcaecilia unicolor]XP_030062226.1 probable proline--tRNA ligase, mitochondrial [Microcaecilia unicolor]
MLRRGRRELLFSLDAWRRHHSRFQHCRVARTKRLLQSQFFQPMNFREDTVPALQGKLSELTCKSQQLMLQAGLIYPSSPGCYSYLPYTVRAMEKLIRLIDKEMQAIGGQKINMPSLCSAELWRVSERWDLMASELFRLRDRHNKAYCLGPTHEEVITDLIASQGTLSYKQFPLLLYQVTRKFRDEPKPRFGLLRSREFYMKDMYTFDVSEEAAHHTYNAVCDAYCHLLSRLGLQFVKVQASTGNIGGQMSHEFQLPAEIGEDRLLVCSGCQFSANVEAVNPGQTLCPACQGKLAETKGIEIGHTFYLGTKYSSSFNAAYSNAQNQPVLAEMGCYGLGVTRMLAAAIEVLSTEDSIRWPGLIAPYQVCFIPPKKGSKEESATALVEALYDDITEATPQLKGDMLLDDRSHFSIGKRLKDAKRLGYPYVIVAGKRVLDTPSQFEVWCQNTGEVVFLSREGVMGLLNEMQAA